MAKRTTTIPTDDLDQTPEPEIMPGQSISTSGKVEKKLAAITNQTAKKLAEEPKARIRIPLPQGMSREQAAREEKPPAVPVCINGYTYQIRMGDWVDVPQPVADLLEQANLI